jgi:hypothetical protein
MTEESYSYYPANNNVSQNHKDHHSKAPEGSAIHPTCVCVRLNSVAHASTNDPLVANASAVTTNATQLALNIGRLSLNIFRYWNYRIELNIIASYIQMPNQMLYLTGNQQP